jgi:SAM-dependent methyltransferase
MNIELIHPFRRNPLVLAAEGLYEQSRLIFPRKNGAYRIVPDADYTESFGYQWNKFAATQIDRSSQLDISRERFFAETGWNREDLSGKNILEVGSGAGRFTQVILDHTPANVYSVDYSNAVEANYRNNGPCERLHLFQASIYELPFAPAQFDKVVCLGVLQHTPDVERSVQALINMVKPGGELVVDFYGVNGWWTKLQAKYVFRPLTRRLSHQRLMEWIDRHMDKLIALSRFFNSIGIGRFVNRFLPLCDIEGTLPRGLTYAQLREWCVLDTFDMFSPAYDQPQRINTVAGWFSKYGMTEVNGRKVSYGHSVASVVSGIKKPD